MHRGNTYTRLLEAYMEAHKLDVDSRWLRIQINEQTTRGKTVKNNVTVVRHENGLGRNKLRRNYPQVEFWRGAMGRTLLPRIYWLDPGTISPPPAKETTRLPTSISANKIHTNNTSAALPRRIPSSGQNRNKKNTTHLRVNSVVHDGMRYHYNKGAECKWAQKIKSHRNNKKCGQTGCSNI